MRGGFSVRKVAGDEDGKVDVVFVHGLGGGAESTWTGRPPVDPNRDNQRGNQADVCWPRDLAPKGARVWLAGYEAPLFEALHRGKIEQGLEEEGTDALRELRGKGIGTKPLIFVAHSLGGLLVKAILVASHREKRRDAAHPNTSIGDTTAAVFFLATPHAGSDRVRIRHAVPLLINLAIALLVPFIGYLLQPLLARWTSNPLLTIGPFVITVHQVLFGWLPALLVAFLIGLARPSRHLRLLDPGSKELRTLQRAFRDFVRERAAIRPVNVRAYFEKYPTSYRGLPLGVLVSWSSADPGLSDVTPEGVDANHVEICKPAAVQQLGLVKLLEQTINTALAGSERLALEGPLRIAQAATKEGSDDWNLLNLVIQARNFENIDADADGHQLRRETELRLRGWLRSNYPVKFQPEMWQLRHARDLSPFSIDRFIWQVVTEHEVREAMQALRKQAEEEMKKWPPNRNAWPGVIPFYRPLRTLERARTGEWGAAELRGEPIELRTLNTMTAEAYKALEAAQNDASGKPPDGDGATRWLLFRMNCVGRAMSVVLEFINYPKRSSGPEDSATQQKRGDMRQQFEAAVKAFERALRQSP